MDFAVTFHMTLSGDCIFDDELYNNKIATSSNSRAVRTVGHGKISIDMQNHGQKLTFSASDAAHVPDEDVSLPAPRTVVVDQEKRCSLCLTSKI